MQLKKGTLVFVHTQSYPPWPAQIQRKYDNGLYKVNFIGQKSYTRIEQDKIDLFTQQRAKQIHSQLQDKKLSKAIFVALKQFEGRKKRGQIDQQLNDLLKKSQTPLNLTMYKNSKQQQFVLQGISKYLPSSSTQDNLAEIGLSLDKLYEYIVSPVNQKLPHYLDATSYTDKTQKIEQQIYKLKQLFLKQQDNYKPNSSSMIRQFGDKQPVSSSSKGSSSMIMMEHHPTGNASKKPFHPSSQQGLNQNQNQNSKSYFIEKLIDTKIIQKLIMTIKAYESFREQNEKQLQQIMNFLKQKFNVFFDKFREEYNKKKLPSHKDRIMLEKFQNFQAYL